QKIYPEKTADEAVSALWDTIYKMVRVDGEDPIEVWNKHNQRLENAFITLNDKQYTKLHLKAPGTDLEVGLPKGHIWHGGAAVSASDIILIRICRQRKYTLHHINIM